MEQRADLVERPRRHECGVAAELAQRFDAEVAVDQHESLAVADRDHRHLLPDLSDRADQPASLIGVVDAQVVMPELELVEVHVHAATLHATRPPRDHGQTAAKGGA